MLLCLNWHSICLYLLSLLVNGVLYIAGLRPPSDPSLDGFFLFPKHNKSGMLFGLDIYVSAIYPRIA